MKKFIGILTLMILVLAGCTAKKPEAVDPHAHEETGVQHVAEKGLLIPDKTQRAIGLKIAEVTKRSMTQQLNVAAQVYRAAAESNGSSAKGNAAASALLPKMDAVKIPEQAAAQIRLRGKTGVTALPGKVTRLDRQLESVTGQTEILLEITDPAGQLRVGDFVDVEFAWGDKSSEALVIPRTALLRSAQGTFAYAQREGHFLRTAVTVGAASAGDVEIREGLTAGEQVADGAVEMLWLIELQMVQGGGHSH